MLSQQLREDLEYIIDQLGISGRQDYRRRKSEDQYYGSQKAAPASVRSYRANIIKQKQQQRAAMHAGKAPMGPSHMKFGVYTTGQ